MQFVEHLRIWYAKFPMIAKASFILPEWPHVKSITNGLKLLRQIHVVRLLWEKEKYLSQIALPIIYWVIDKDINGKISGALV